MRNPHPPTEGELREQRIRAVFFDALQLCAMAGIPKKNGFADVYVGDLERLNRSVTEAEQYFTETDQASGNSDEGWTGCSEDEAEERKGWQRG